MVLLRVVTLCAAGRVGEQWLCPLNSTARPLSEYIRETSRRPRRNCCRRGNSAPGTAIHHYNERVPFADGMAIKWPGVCADGGRTIMNLFFHRTRLRVVLLGMMAGRAPKVRRLRLVL